MMPICVLLAFHKYILRHVQYHGPKLCLGIRTEVVRSGQWPVLAQHIFMLPCCTKNHLMRGRASHNNHVLL
jgi:hypothetical protein